jgi:two-component system chemotaxis sensor kinase CheA
LWRARRSQESMATNRKNRPLSKAKKPRKPHSSAPRKNAAPAAVPAPAAHNLTVDDAVALMLQLEPDNLSELRQVRSIIETLLAAATEKASRTELSHALEAFDRIINSSSDDPPADFTATMACLEAARKTDEQPCQVFDHEVTRTQEPPTRERIVESAPGIFELPADADRELIGEFIAEGKDLVEGAEAALLSLETDPENMDSVNTVFRTFHTIKGTSAFLGLSAMSEFAHRAESLLSRVREREIRFGGLYADLALRSADILKELLRGVQELLGGKSAALPQGYYEVLRMLENPDAAAAEETPQDIPDEQPANEAPPFKEPVPCEQTPQAASEPAEVSSTAVSSSAAGNLRSEKPNSSRGEGVHSSLRVRTDRLDRLVDMVGELVIAESMVSQDQIVHQPINHDLLRKVTHAGKIVRELQDLAMSMRMVPLKGVFQKMARLVRDLAHKSGKAIDFIAEGEETEIDRNMVDILSDPIVHMIRNAIDHGIESPEVRAAQGKPQTGVIRLAAYHSGGNVVIELQDDGRGLDREKIIERAVTKGLIESDRKLSDIEVFRLIFLPGFSTSEKVTEISGRGVGMDVVKQSVEALHGHIDLASEPGKGCTFFVRLPLTLAITDGMLVKVGSERYIIPTINIHLSFKPEKSALWTVAGRGEMVMLRGELMPLFRLHRLFGIDSAVSDPTSGLLVVVGEAMQRCALLVDELLGQQQVVAKSLGKGMTKVQGIAGGAILGDGRVGLIIDAMEIISLARRVSNNGTLPGSHGLSAA